MAYAELHVPHPVLGAVQSPRWELLYATTPDAFLPEKFVKCRVDPHAADFFIPELIAHDGGSSWSDLMRYLDDLAFSKFPSPELPERVRAGMASSTHPSDAHSIDRPSDRMPAPSPRVPEPPSRPSPEVHKSLSPPRKELFDAQSHRLFSTYGEAHSRHTGRTASSNRQLTPRGSGRAASAASSVLLQDGVELHLSPRHMPRGLGTDITRKVVRGSARARYEISTGAVLTPRGGCKAREAAKDADFAAQQATFAEPAARRHAAVHPATIDRAMLDRTILEFDAAHRRSQTWQQRLANKQLLHERNLELDPIDLHSLTGRSDTQSHGRYGQKRQGEAREEDEAHGGSAGYHANRVLDCALNRIFVPEAAAPAMSTSPRSMENKAGLEVQLPLRRLSVSKGE